MAQLDISSLQDMLAQIDSKREQILKTISLIQKEESPTHLKFRNSKYFDYFYNDINIESLKDYSKKVYPEIKKFSCTHEPTFFSKNYYLFTFTFSPDVSKTLTEYEQKMRLIYSFELFKKFDCPIWACIEKHKSGILHAHLLTVIDPQDIQSINEKIKPKLTCARKVYPAIKYDLVKRTELDILRTYKYIWEHKKDHPFYKYLYFYY